MNSAATNDHSAPVWFTSSYSNGAGGECVECAVTEHSALIRDSKRPESSVIAVDCHSWGLFLQAVKHERLTA
ncbi:DUF397 domain-containing protein [Streptomyces sp. NPDC059785]|uniref:DUF397 domain-containing protein n=1 Tax=Streptomyces sp. NPDC059785 TaxID=3346945 RepID=UPI00364A85DA